MTTPPIEWNETGLERLLTPKQASEYLTQLKLHPTPPSLNFLTQIIERTYAIIPFQNLTMLTRPRVPPTKDEIINDMLTGIGGLCTTINPFICALLQVLGFNAGLVQVSLAQPDCHIGIVVDLAGQHYWTDLGNGFPYLQPLPLQHRAEARHPNFTWRLLQTGTRWEVEQTVFGTQTFKVNQHFQLETTHYSSFEAMRNSHYTNPDYGPFLTGLRINCWTAQGGHLLRNNLIWDLPGDRRKADLPTITQWLHRRFTGAASQLTPLLKESWQILGMK